jgi:K+-sensing histidine kinase KdpD
MTDRGPALVRGGAVVAPVVVAAVLSLLRAAMANSSAALVLVLVVVAVSVAGDRVAGVLAALVAAVSFDFFLTEPYYQLAIFGRDDVETAVLLVAIGIAVTEIVQWGRRQQARSGRREGYLSGVANAARMASDDASPDDLVATVGRMIFDVLDLDDCTFDAAPDSATDRPRFGRDGELTWRGAVVDVARDGLPTMDVIELPAGRGGDKGRFLLTASSRVRRPDRESVLVAITLAEQVDDRPGDRQRGSAPATA